MHYSLTDIYLSIVWVLTTYVQYLWYKFLPKPTKFVPAGALHEPSVRVKDISATLKTVASGTKIKIDRSARSQASNSMRMTTRSAHAGITIAMGPADRVLLIDREKCQVIVEPGVTMEQLVDALLPHQLVPFVVPEFKALTVGGVIAGAGIESSSWAHGQFADSLIEAQYVLADGRVIECSPEHETDFFYGALGACGTLGLLTKAKLRVQKITTNYVKVQYFEIPISKSIAALTARTDYMRKSTQRLGLIDGIVYKNCSVIVTAEYGHSGPATQSFSRGRDPWFYQYVASRKRSSDILHIKDYLFRYDAGAFWMSQYAIAPFTDLQSLVQSFLPPVTDPYTNKILTLIPFGGYNRLSRWLLSPLLRTDPMYKRLHQAPIADIADSLVIQDVYIPSSKADEFLTWIRTHFGAEKIWLCPMHESSTPQIFSPHHVASENNHRERFINFGIWLHKAPWQPGTSFARTATRHIERKVALLGGRKMLYSLSYYAEDEWNSLYDMTSYHALKRKFDSKYAFGDIYEKVGHAA